MYTCIVLLLLPIVLNPTVSLPSQRAPRWAVDTVNPAPDAQPDHQLEDILSNTGPSLWLYVWLFLTSIPLFVIFCCLFWFRSFVLDCLRRLWSVAFPRRVDRATFECSEPVTSVDQEDLELRSLSTQTSDEGLETEGVQVRYDDVSNLVTTLALLSVLGAEPSGISSSAQD